MDIEYLEQFIDDDKQIFLDGYKNGIDDVVNILNDIIGCEPSTILEKALHLKNKKAKEFIAASEFYIDGDGRPRKL